MAGPNEPSMEEILASIKKVIAEEPPIAPPARPVVDDDMPEEEEEADVLDLAPDMADEEAAAEPEHDTSPQAGAGFVPSSPPAEVANLMADEAADASRSRLEELAGVAAGAPQAAGYNPMEEMVRDMLRPMLKAWLDERLPGIVDEHVRREISRITGRKL